LLCGQHEISAMSQLDESVQKTVREAGILAA
jgi:hypothetical protein